MIYRVCCLAGSASLIDNIRADLDADGVRAAMRKRDTAAVFDWLIAALSYQGISDQIAYDYMEQHGYVQMGRHQPKTCPRRHLPQAQELLALSRLPATTSSAEPAPSPITLRRCPLPTHDLRNGRLNQTAYSLYLFIRDIADGDLIGWIDQRLQAANTPAGPGPVGPHARRAHRAAARDLRRLRQGADHGLVLHPARSAQKAAALA